MIFSKLRLGNVLFVFESRMAKMNNYIKQLLLMI